MTLFSPWGTECAYCEERYDDLNQLLEHVRQDHAQSPAAVVANINRDEPA